MTKIIKGSISKPPLDLDILKNQFTWRRWFDDIFKALGPPNNMQGTVDLNVTGLTITGNPIITASYYRIGFFIGLDINIEANGGTTSCVAGTTFFDLPFPAMRDGFCVANNINSKINVGSGFVQKSPGGIYPPSWSATSDDISIFGFYLVTQ